MNLLTDYKFLCYKKFEAVKQNDKLGHKNEALYWVP